MLYHDYTWDLEPTRIVLDSELNTDRLGWKAGDCFKFINVDGQQQLIKIDLLEKFTRGIE